MWNRTNSYTIFQVYKNTNCETKKSMRNENEDFILTKNTKHVKCHVIQWNPKNVIVHKKLLFDKWIHEDTCTNQKQVKFRNSSIVWVHYYWDQFHYSID